MQLMTQILWAIPCACLLVAAWPALRSRATPWFAAEVVLAVAATGSLLSTLWVISTHAMSDLAGHLVLTLVTTLGWIITRYSRTYLQGERHQSRYLTALLFTLASISTVILAQRLDLLTLAWVASSLGLHQLLTFYDDRAAALIAAHKKFIASRAADACMMVALLLIHYQCGSFYFADLTIYIPASQQPPVLLQVAMLLIVFAVILKSAQLPVHGWLIQVMEAPTPVSALLHAGIVNIGGFVLIRMAALLDHTVLARVVLVLAGTLTAVFASLVMMTRISIKVRLAWSTCAQMGFMLMECGLGWYDLALLHLLAHSLYKAYAFLSAGDTVLLTGRDQLLIVHHANPVSRFILAVIAAPLSVTAAGMVILSWSYVLPDVHISGALLVVFGLGLAPLLWTAGTIQHRSLWRGILLQVSLTSLYLWWHYLLARHINIANDESFASQSFVIISFALLYLVQCWLTCFADSPVARRWYPRVYAGFYLDELFTRLTFLLWPPRMPVARREAITREVTRGTV